MQHEDSAPLCTLVSWASAMRMLKKGEGVQGEAGGGAGALGGDGVVRGEGRRGCQQ